MKSIIGGYASFMEAQRAVLRELRPRLSTQDVVIAERARTVGRKLQPTRAQELRWKDHAAFLVMMTAEPDVIARARRLLDMDR
ncbi:MAG: hypothetical protein ABW252_06000 [Polyangiales bacterium]